MPRKARKKLNQRKGINQKGYSTRTRKNEKSTTSDSNMSIRKGVAERTRQKNIQFDLKDLLRSARESDFQATYIEVKDEIRDQIEPEDLSVDPLVGQEVMFEIQTKDEQGEFVSYPESNLLLVLNEDQDMNAVINGTDMLEHPEELGVVTAHLCDCKTLTNDTGNRLVMDHQKLDQYRCGVCNFKTNSMARLRMHTSARHNDPLQVTECRCDICGYTSKFAGNLRQHMFVHMQRAEVVYRCDMCPFETNNCTDLGLHRSTHRVVKTFKTELGE